jgi:hypothetical protein
VVVAGCGTAHKNATAPPPPPPATTPPTTTSSSAVPPLQGEAASAATGDIPDNQVFLVFRNRAAGYQLKYPEGWAQQGNGKRVVFRDKNNIVQISVGTGPAATTASVRRELSGQPSLKVTQPLQRMTISGAPAIKVVYTTQSAANQVTGKRVTLTVDRYYLAHSGRTAVVDLGTPVGVDNVDAYRLMIQSFRWR